MRKFVFNEETAALDVVKAVGHGNTFLTSPHTLRNFKKELHFWDPKKLEWEATYSDKMVPEARRIAKQILKEHQVAPIDKAALKQGDELIRHTRRPSDLAAKPLPSTLLWPYARAIIMSV